MFPRLSSVGRAVRPCLLVGCLALSWTTAAEQAEQTPQQAAIAAAIRDGNRPDRLNSMMTPPAFDHEAYLADKATYLADHVPSRVWMMAQAGPAVAPVAAVGDEFGTAVPGGTVVFIVRAEPGSPCTAVSWDGGVFVASQTTCLTVEADAEGLATFAWLATPGTIGDCHFSVSSPLNSGLVDYFIQVQDDVDHTAVEEAP